MRGELCTMRAPAKVAQAARYSVPPVESSELLLRFLPRTLRRTLRYQFTSRLVCWKRPDGPHRRRLSRSRRMLRTLRRPERDEMAYALQAVWSIAKELNLPNRKCRNNALSQAFYCSSVPRKL